MLSIDPSGGDDAIAMMRFNHQLELNQTLTTLYLIIEVGRWDTARRDNFEIRQALCEASSLTLDPRDTDAHVSCIRAGLSAIPDTDYREATMG